MANTRSASVVVTVVETVVGKVENNFRQRYCHTNRIHVVDAQHKCVEIAVAHEVLSTVAILLLEEAKQQLFLIYSLQTHSTHERCLRPVGYEVVKQ